VFVTRQPAVLRFCDRLPHKTGPRYNRSAVKLEIELNIAADAAVTAGLQEHLRRKPSWPLFAGRKIPAGKAARNSV